MAESSDWLFARAREVTPGGVNSPVRAFGAVGGVPRFMVRGSGPLPCLKSFSAARVFASIPIMP